MRTNDTAAPAAVSDGSALADGPGQEPAGTVELPGLRANLHRTDARARHSSLHTVPSVTSFISTKDSTCIAREVENAYYEAELQRQKSSAGTNVLQVRPAAPCDTSQTMWVSSNDLQAL